MDEPQHREPAQLEALIVRAEELLADVDLLGLTAVSARLSMAVDQLYLEREKLGL